MKMVALFLILFAQNRGREERTIHVMIDCNGYSIISAAIFEPWQMQRCPARI